MNKKTVWMSDPFDLQRFVDAQASVYGPTRLLGPKTPRSGDLAALGADLQALSEALGSQSAVYAGYDRGGRAALWPERCSGLVSLNGYNVQNIASSAKPAPVQDEVALWYQW
jgi:hypothetical protein